MAYGFFIWVSSFSHVLRLSGLLPLKRSRSLFWAVGCKPSGVKGAASAHGEHGEICWNTTSEHALSRPIMIDPSGKRRPRSNPRARYRFRSTLDEYDDPQLIVIRIQTLRSGGALLQRSPSLRFSLLRVSDVLLLRRSPSSTSPLLSVRSNKTEIRCS